MVLTDILVSEVLQPRGAYLVEVVENRLSHLASELRRERKLKFTSDIKAIREQRELAFSFALGGMDMHRFASFVRVEIQPPAANRQESAIPVIDNTQSP